MFDETELKNLPPHMINGLTNYINYGWRPGSFLTAVLCNDFCTAAIKADATNANAFRDWALVLHNALPITSWGDKETVERWSAAGGLKGQML